MKNFRFENIWLLSHREQRARKVTFHPKKNLILGRNHTGKSTVIRFLFETLGASPEGTLERWDESALSAVEFSVDQLEYRALYQRGKRALFSSDGTLIVATGNYQIWNEHFSQITGFNLVFSDKEAESQQGDPICRAHQDMEPALTEYNRRVENLSGKRRRNVEQARLPGSYATLQK